MPTNEPSPNGRKPTLDGLNLEEVDPADLTIEDEPSTVEVVQKKNGFGIWMALAWCLAFVIVTQIAPGLVYAGLLFAGSALGIGPSIANDPNALLDLLKSQSTVNVLMVSALVMMSAFALVILRLQVGPEWRRRIALRLPHREHLAIVLVAFLPLMVAFAPLENFINRNVPSVTDLFGMQDVKGLVKTTADWHWSLAVLLIAVGPALGEELWFRGYLGQGLGARYGNWGAVLIASLFFGVVHLDPPQAIGAFFLGIILHLTYLATRSLLVPMLLHFLNNGLGVLEISRTGNLPIASNLETAFEYRPWLMFAMSMLVLFSAGAALYHSRVRLWTSDGKEAVNAPYAHVEYPPAGSRYEVYAGPVSPLHMLALMASTAAFAAAWFGL